MGTARQAGSQAQRGTQLGKREQQQKEAQTRTGWEKSGSCWPQAPAGRAVCSHMQLQVPLSKE